MGGRKPMTTRFDVERAVLASDLPSLDRLVMLVLLTHADVDPVSIPAKFTPSLTGLASESGLDRTTVQRRLRRLEAGGWIIRQPPPVEQSRKGVRTRYQLAVPVGAHGTYPVGAGGTQLGAQGTQGGCTCHLPVDADSTLPRCPVHPMSIHPYVANQSNPRASGGSRNGTRPPAWLEKAVDVVAEGLTAATGRAYDRRDITDSVTSFLGGKKVTNPGAYIRKCADENPMQFEPTGMPPRYRKEDYQ